MNNRIKYLVGVLIFLASGCHPISREARLVDFVNDPANKIVQKINTGDLKVTAKFFPPDYNRLLRRNVNDSAGREKSNSDYYYFNIKFDKAEPEKITREKMLYLDFDMQKDFALVAGGDSIIPAICQKIENGVSGSYEFMLAFERQPGTRDLSLHYNDKVFGAGSLEFVFNKRDLARIPGINLNK